MRNPLRKAGYCLALALPATGGLYLATYEHERLGETVGTTIGIVSLTVTILSFCVFFIFLFMAIKMIRRRRAVLASMTRQPQG